MTSHGAGTLAEINCTTIQKTMLVSPIQCRSKQIKHLLSLTNF